MCYYFYKAKGAISVYTNLYALRISSKTQRAGNMIPLPQTKEKVFTFIILT